MPLPSTHLRLEAIGVQNYVPPPDVPDASGLKDGIHLRWGFTRSIGFPWHGFYLFRREHVPGKPVCADKTFASLQTGQLQTDTLTTNDGTLSSPRNLRLTDDFPLFGQIEFDLTHGLRYIPPEPAYIVDIKVGLRGGSSGETCIDFRRQSGEVSAPLTRQGATFQTFDFNGTPESTLRPINIGGTLGLNIRRRMEIRIDCPADIVTLWITNGATPPILTARDQRGKVIDQAQSQLQGEIERIELTGGGIEIIEIDAPQNEVALHELCYLCPDKQTEDPEPLVVTALADGIPVATERISGAAGAVISVQLAADQIDAIAFGAGDAALIEVCIIPVSQDVREKWEAMSGVERPLCLPVGHPDYPCPGAPVNFGSARVLADARVRYDLPAEWQIPDSFAELHEQLSFLVQSGPSGGPMATRSTSVPVVDNSTEPAQLSMTDQFPLDTVLLGALYSALAQMLGLYWVDTDAVPGQAYDYLVVGDYDLRFSGAPEEVLDWIANNGFIGMEAAIVFNRRVGDAPPLLAPNDVRSYALPGGVFPDADGVLRDAQNAAGLRWNIPHITRFGQTRLLPYQPVMYEVWRHDFGLFDPSGPAASLDHKRITSRPLLVTDPTVSDSPERASDWPPFPLFAQDRGLADGWYGYRIHGIDIFGRSSSLSQSARWFQWSPRPDPAPYYYQLPVGNRDIHPFALQLLDKLPPPPPTGVEAQALDPEDPYLLRDSAYQSWFMGLSATEQANLIGLRVRWRWTVAHQRQAPDTAEFRLYFHPGAASPAPDGRVATHWQSRIYVVAFENHVTVEPDGTRVYEIFLPTSTDLIRYGVPLVPSLTDPVVYANVGVTAVDDKKHTGDDAKWTSGNWGGRSGNEGTVSAPATIYRVWRERPTPPVPPPDSERVFATPADYHSRSFYTYRWQPAPHLKTHVLRALDATLFQTDWVQRTYTVDAANQDIFPSELRGNAPDIVARRVQIAAELNAINGLPRTTAEDKRAAMQHYRTLSNDALRVLAGLPETSRAFTQLTTEPLDPTHAANADRRGPDSPDNYIPNPLLRAYTDTLDGRSTNRYFYRAAYVDGANNRSDLSLSSPPVYLPDVTPPSRPLVHKVIGGDMSITIVWRTGLETGLASYHVYRTDVAANARDIRLMDMVTTIPVEPDVSLRGIELTWVDTGVVLGKLLHYRLIATDTDGNQSQPSDVVSASAYRFIPPRAPQWQSAAWNLTATGIELTWTSTEPNLQYLIQRRTLNDPRWRAVSRWLTTEATVDDLADATVTYLYRIKARDIAGNLNTHFSVVEVQAAQ